MLKKSIGLFLLSTSMLASLAFSQDYTLMASVPTQFEQQNKPDQEIMQETQAPAATQQAPVQLDRSGVDRASVHLQILQQSNNRLSESTQPAAAPAPAKKTAAEDKKSQSKAASTS
ncbi:hypothetical protein [Undibacterium sp. TJN19]|uniref:hypothetical protein n=1 Tax=Undibacterium sp. TJN19 TaxID=3413055 RepID=UPI003BEF966C